MSYYSDPTVARYTRKRKPVPLWFWLASGGFVLAVVAVSVLVATGRSLRHPFESPDERMVREHFEKQFTPFTIEAIEKRTVEPLDAKWMRSRSRNGERYDEFWIVSLRRPSALRGGTETIHYCAYLKNGRIEYSVP